MNQQYIKNLLLSGLVTFSLLGCSTTEDRLRQCQAEYKNYQQRVEKFYEQEIDKRVGAIKEENAELNASIIERDKLINSMSETIKNMRLRIGSEESAVSHFKYCQFWGGFAFFCDAQKAEIGANYYYSCNY